VADWEPSFDVAGEDERFLFFRNPAAGATDRQIVVVQSWHSEFEDRE
jgi:hypothetical protein